MAGKGKQGGVTIVIRKEEGGEAGHHGGAWKVAYADFVTAMMAFFLLLWLLNVTTDEQKSGVADYFAPTSLSSARSGAGDILAGRTLADAGAKVGEGAPPVAVVQIGPPTQITAQPTQEDINRAQAVREQDAFDKAQAQLEAALQGNPQIAALKENLVIDMTPDG